MTTFLSTAQLVAVDEQAGFSPHDAATAAAVQTAESHGAYGNLADLEKALAGTLTPGSYPGLAYYPHGSAGGGPEVSVGPSQINLIAHPGVDPIKAMTDPLYNAQQAYAISNHGQNFGPWSTFTSGAYRQYLPGAEAAAATVPGPAAATAPSSTTAGFTIPGTGVTIPSPGDVWDATVGNITGGLSGVPKDVVGGIGKLLAPVGRAIERTGLIAIGLIFVLVAFVILAHAGGATGSSGAGAVLGRDSEPPRGGGRKTGAVAKVEEAPEAAAEA